MNQQSHSHTAISDAPGSLQTINSSLGFLRQYAPYADIPEDLLREVLSKSSLGYYPQGSTVFSPDDGVPRHFCVVQQGLVTGRRIAGDDESVLFESGPGETFLNVALLEKRVTRTWHQADNDSFIIEIPRGGFDLLIRESPAFVDFCQRRASTFIDSARMRMRADAASSLQGELTLDTPLVELAQRSPLICGPRVSVQKAVAMMHLAEVGSIVVVNDANAPIGIFTLRDLRGMIAGAEHGLDTEIATVMTTDPLALQASQPAYEAAMVMVKHHIGHVLILDRGTLAGVISERDLFALKKVNLVQLARNIDKAESPSELRAIRESIIILIRTMLAAGASARQLTGIITRLNDAMVQRVIHLCRSQHQEPVPDFTWLSFGSEARGEQTLATDQDNGILFDPGRENPETLRQQLLPLARRINEVLDQVGFPLCRGNIMAGNPELCLSPEEWQAKYQRIIHTTTPEHLLQATIFLDFRPLYGDTAPVGQLRDRMLAQIGDNSIFLYALTQDALASRPPLGTFRSFVTQKGEQGKTLDLKKSGLQPIIAGIRILALAHGVTATNTEDRIDALCQQDRLQPPDAAAWKEAFAFIQLLRLKRNEQQMETDLPLSNLIDPYSLNPLEKRILKEALRQATRLQSRLKLDYT